MKSQLFYKNPYQFEFEARVIDQIQEDDLFAVVLSETCFYPGGGGQPADRGYLNKIPVVKMKQENGVIKHYLPTPLYGNIVHGQIDSRWRIDFMQQHTGQHIISAALYKIGNYETVSVHLGEEYTAVELNSPQIPLTHILKAEELANDVVLQNLPVLVHYVSPEEISKFPLRRISQHTGTIRIVEIKGFDYSGCGGTHVQRTGEVRLIKFIGQERIRQRMRLQFKIGNRALGDYGKKHEIITILHRELSCGTDEILGAIHKLKEQVKSQRRQIQELQKEFLPMLASHLIRDAEVINHVHLIFQVYEDKDMNRLRILANALQQSSYKTIFLLFNISTDNENINWMFGTSEDVAINLREVVEPLLPIIEGKGGGKGTLFMGGAKSKNQIPHFLKSARTEIVRRLKNE